MKRFACLALAGLMLLGLAACSGAASSAPAASTAAGEGYLPAPGAYPGEAADQLDPGASGEGWRYAPIEGDEEYDDTGESPFKDVLTSPLSTFSSDVDTASYSNMRRFVTNGMRPEGVRIEELVNYFDYAYDRPAPGSEHPFTVSAEVAPCPWNPAHLLAMVGVQGEALPPGADIPSNIVLLLDVSGSMSAPNKLPLLRESFQLMLPKLTDRDVVSIVTYAGSDQIVADSVPGSEHRTLARLIDRLEAGGSTAGARGLQTAYELAEKNFIEGGNNRVILATDGDFNVGQSSVEALKRQIEQARETGVYISVLGFGMGNLKDNMMETIADCGNGNYAYIDNLNEARKVLVDEFDSTLYTIANDLKFQLEFNSAAVAQYRLIGYNNRRLDNEDFEDDQKDAGDIGAGHSVTAFYELVPQGDVASDGGVGALPGQRDVASDGGVGVLPGGGAEDGGAPGGGLRYQYSTPTGSDEFCTVSIRYKRPGEQTSRLVEQAVGPGRYTETPSRDFLFASAVAEYGLILTESRYQGEATLADVLARAKAGAGEDPYGLRAEFIELVGQYRRMVD